MGLFLDSVAAQKVETINNRKATNEYRGRQVFKKRAIHAPMSSKQVHQKDIIKDIS